MFKIYQMETKTLYSDLFETYEEAVKMARWFIDDDNESFTEPDYTYGIIDTERHLLSVIKNSTYIDLKDYNFNIPA